MDNGSTCVRVLTEGGRLAVAAPYHPAFPDRARALGGRWDPRRFVWTFDAREEAAVRAVLVDIFGEDGSGNVPRVDVRLFISDWPHPELWLFGRLVLRRPGRDLPVRPGPGVAILSGEFARRGGSSKHPEISCGLSGEVVVIVHDVPLSLAQRAAERGTFGAQIVSAPEAGGTDAGE